jgi:hypothetical protein
MYPVHAPRPDRADLRADRARSTRRACRPGSRSSPTCAGSTRRHRALPLSELASFGFELLIGRALERAGRTSSPAPTPMPTTRGSGRRRACDPPLHPRRPRARPSGRGRPGACRPVAVVRASGRGGGDADHGRHHRLWARLRVAGPAEQVGLAAHHVLHVALRHPTGRRRWPSGWGPRFDASLYGLAADGIINETLLLAGHALPRPAVTLTDLLSEIGRPAKSAGRGAGRLGRRPVGDAAPFRPETRREGARLGRHARLRAGPEPWRARRRPASGSRPRIGATSSCAPGGGAQGGHGIGRLGAILADMAPGGARRGRCTCAAFWRAR